MAKKASGEAEHADGVSKEDRDLPIVYREAGHIGREAAHVCRGAVQMRRRQRLE